MNKDVRQKLRTYNPLILLAILLLGVLSACNNNRVKHPLLSPDDQVEVVLDVHEGFLYYKLNWKGENMMDTSLLSIMTGFTVKITDTEYHSSDSTWQPVWGQFSEIRDHYNEMMLSLDIEGTGAKLFVRAYNEGVAFRFQMDKLPTGLKPNFYVEHKLNGEDQMYWPAGESEPRGPYSLTNLLQSKEKPPKMAMPLVIEREDDLFMSVLESDLYSAQGFDAMNVKLDKDRKHIYSYNVQRTFNPKVITPWRVILLGETAGDLVTSTMPVNLATPCQLENTDWIKPGKTLWDWRVHGYTAPDGFKYGISTESYKRFIDFAALKGIEYFLIDDSWYKHATKGHFELSDKLDLQEVIRYAEEKDVDLILYYDRRHGEYGDDELFPYYQSLGMKGIKYGFMGRNADFSRQAIKKSAASELLIDFHDGPVPFTGVRRTYPNAITREYCHAQQDSRRAFTPGTFIKMALINAIQGPLDMNNGNFDLTGINSGKREKGPRKKNSYYSTVVGEAARTLIIFSGLVCIPDAPEAYLEKEDLFEFIQKQPVGKWDETRILHSKMGEYITTARRHGKEWFVGSVVNQNGGSLFISFDFLEPNRVYEATFYEDAKDTHCVTNPETYNIRTTGVVKDDVLEIKMAPGGGHCMWIRPRTAG